ncbi:MAG: DUF6133 family protein [Oscillospiraceae bacterium]|nr:DUF6133 family protein [Oscillospiraceae bacterium]
MIKRVKTKTCKAKESVDRAYTKIICAKQNAMTVLSDETGDIQIGLAVKIIIGVVIGALVLAGVYALWENVIMPRLGNEVNEMFNV